MPKKRKNIRRVEKEQIGTGRKKKIFLEKLEKA